MSLLTLCLALAGRGAERAPHYVGGIQVNEPIHELWFDALGAAGLTTVATTVYARQGDWDSDHLWWNEEEEAVVAEVRRAKERGFRVALILRVALDHAFERNRFLWHGMIMPAEDRELEVWFDQYEEFVSRWAGFAEEEGVDLLGVGSELSALASTTPVRELPILEEYWTNDEKVASENRRVLELLGASSEYDVPSASDGTRYPTMAEYLDRYAEAHGAWARAVAYLDRPFPISEINRRRAALESRWRRLIGRVRAVYGGELTFAANFDQYDQVGFWDALDVIGINAYFPLRDEWRANAPREGYRSLLVEGWRDVFREIDAFRGRIGLGDRDVVFTELGYVRRENSSFRPWAADGYAIVADGEVERLLFWRRQRPSPDERQAALEALAEVAADEPFRGALYWKLSTYLDQRPIEPFAIILGDPGDRGAVEALAELAR